MPLCETFTRTSRTAREVMRGYPITPERRQEILALPQGPSASEVADRCGVSKSTVAPVRRRAKLARPTEPDHVTPYTDKSFATLSGLIREAAR
jgi:hypothetical protein